MAQSDLTQPIIEIDQVKKQYRLGTIGGGTLTADLQSWWARLRGKEDPNIPIGTDTRLFGQNFMALNGVNLNVNSGDTLGIIGANGAGKSTLLKLLCRITAPSEGEIRIRGRISSMLEVGTGFHAEMTGRENIYMNGAILGMTRAEIDSKIDDIIEFSECQEFIDTPVKRYSSGMYVKLAFAVAAHLNSEILIMDEVLAVGDVRFQQKCIDKMSQLASGDGRTILYVSHNMNTIRQLCNRCVVLKEGRVIYDGDVDGAINIYMEKTETRQIFYDLREFPRGPYGNRVHIDSLEFLGNTPGEYLDGENLRFRLKWRLHENISGMQFRCMMKYSFETPIGLSTTVPIEDLPVGNYTTIHELDLSKFPQGSYCFRICFYLVDNYQQDVVLDVVNNFFFFEKVTDNENRLKWKRQIWGHLWLDDMKMTITDIDSAKP